MHIYIIAQHLELADHNPDRLVKLGEKLAERQHDVTVITGNSSIDFDLGKKKLGLTHVKGMTVITLNVPADNKKNWLIRYFNLLKFARLAGEQGKMLPKPDLILALAPPLTAVKPALELSEYLKVPLVVEMRELWPSALLNRGELHRGLLKKQLAKLEEKVFKRAQKLIFDSRDMALKVKEQKGLDARIAVIDKQLNDEPRFRAYIEALGLAN